MYFILFIKAVAAQQADDCSVSGKIYEHVDVSPGFPGGIDSLRSFINRNLHYPDSERDCDIQGKVLLQLVIGIDGKVKDVMVIRSFGQAMDNEAVRVARMLADFSPALLDGKKVCVYYNLPVVFHLQ